MSQKRSLDTQFTVKVVLYGREGAGKSTLMTRYIFGRFDNELGSTIGAALNSKRIKSGFLQIWDTAGSERFNAIMPLYLRGAKVILLCFEEPDLSVIESKLNKIFEVNTEAEIFLVATKMDLPKPQDYDDISKYASDHNYKLFFTSSATGQGVDQVFEQAAVVGLALAQKDEPGPGIAPVKFTTLSAVDDKSGSCCG